MKDLIKAIKIIKETIIQLEQLDSSKIQNINLDGLIDSLKDDLMELDIEMEDKI